MLSKRQVDKAFTEPQAKIVGEIIESALPPVHTPPARPPALQACDHTIVSPRSQWNEYSVNPEFKRPSRVSA